jgi:quercetin dioxygenase-like cupin family protein
MKIGLLSEITPAGVSHNPAILKRVMVRNGTVPHLTNFTQSVFPPGEVAPEHSHDDMYEVFLVESGSGVFVVNGETQSVGPGSFVLIELGDSHAIKNDGVNDLVLTYFGIEV